MNGQRYLLLLLGVFALAAHAAQRAANLAPYDPQADPHAELEVAQTLAAQEGRLTVELCSDGRPQLLHRVAHDVSSFTHAASAASRRANRWKRSRALPSRRLIVASET